MFDRVVLGIGYQVAGSGYRSDTQDLIYILDFAEIWPGCS